MGLSKVEEVETEGILEVVVDGEQDGEVVEVEKAKEERGGPLSSESH